MSELPARVIKGYRTNRRGGKIPIYTEESVTARKEAIALEKQKADETRPVNTIRVKTTGRNGTKVYQRWDGTQWLTATGNDVAKYRSLYNNQQELAEQLEDPKPPGGYNATVDKESQEVNKLPLPKYNQSKFEGKSTKNLRYPLASMGADQDYIQFGVIEYKRKGLTEGVVGSGQSFEDNLAKNILGTVTLPIPSQIGDNNVQNYGPSELNFLQERGLAIAKSGIGGDIDGAVKNATNLVDRLVGAENNANLATNFFANQAINAFGGNVNINQLLARSNGLVINPNMELLFSGPGLRNFTFQFKMTPRSAVEGEAIRQIIRVFKRHSAPKGAGDFLKTPDIFQIRYLTGQKNHPFLNRFKLCALTNMQVNYTGDGVYATYDNGTPVSMIMTLNFQELTPVYAEDYENTEGVGY